MNEILYAKHRQNSKNFHPKFEIDQIDDGSGSL